MRSKQAIQQNSADFVVQKMSNLALVIILQSFFSIIWLLLIPKEPENAVILGYSLRRLALLLPMALPLLAGVLMRMGTTKKSAWLQKLIAEENLPKTSSWLVVGGALIAFGVWSFAFLFFFIGFFPDLGAYYRLIPMMLSYFLLGVEALSAVPLWFYPPKNRKNDNQEKFPWKTFLIILASLVVIFILIEATGLGKNPERVSIISLGSPILEGQIWYIVGLLVLIMLSAYAWQCIPAKNNVWLRKNGDFIIAAVLWMTAVILWMSLPLPKHNYFAPQVQPPNFEKYPFSDAEQYDLNALWVYYGTFENYVISKPFYVSFLTILHAIGGLSYANIVFLQTLVIALFPPLLYLIGRELHSRLGGIALALFAIFREFSSIQASSIANVSNTKLLLSDMPAALLAALFVYVITRWIKSGKKGIGKYEFLLGGLIGALILTRIQTLMLVPFALILIIILYFPKFKPMLISILVLVAALSLILTPVLLRNHAITGVFWVDNPSSSGGLSNILTKGVEFESELELQENENVVKKNIQTLQMLLSENLYDYLHFVIDNFCRNLISSFSTIPIRLGNGISFIDFLTINEPFWAEVYSHPNIINTLLIIVNLSIISLGLSKALKHNPLIIFFTLGFYIVYNLSSALVRLSGWRFILPVDWIVYGFYALGLLEALLWIFQHITTWDIRPKTSWLTSHRETPPKSRAHWSFYAGFGMLFLLCGAFIPAREHLLPSLAPDYSRQEVCNRVDSALRENSFESLQDNFMDFCLSENTRVFKGYGIYPRFFKEGEGYYDRSYDPWFGKQDYARLVFRVIGNPNAKVYIKTNNGNIHFPNGEVVYAVGREKTKFEAQFVLVDGPQPTLIVSSALAEGKEGLMPLE